MLFVEVFDLCGAGNRVLTARGTADEEGTSLCRGGHPAIAWATQGWLVGWLVGPVPGESTTSTVAGSNDSTVTFEARTWTFGVSWYVPGASPLTSTVT